MAVLLSVNKERTLALAHTNLMCVKQALAMMVGKQRLVCACVFAMPSYLAIGISFTHTHTHTPHTHTHTPHTHTHTPHTHTHIMPALLVHLSFMLFVVQPPYSMYYHDYVALFCHSHGSSLGERLSFPPTPLLHPPRYACCNSHCCLSSASSQIDMACTLYLGRRGVGVGHGSKEVRHGCERRGRVEWL